MSPPDRQTAEALLQHSEPILSRHDVESAIDRIADSVSRDWAKECPLILSVMGGAVVFTGHLLPKLQFPLQLDILKASRYGEATQGGQVRWSLRPQISLEGRSILLVDDILDEGHTLAEIVSFLQSEGAKTVRVAVLFDKVHGRPKPLHADYVGCEVPDRYVFGWGMDVAGYWRNLDQVWALKESGFALLK